MSSERAMLASLNNDERVVTIRCRNASGEEIGVCIVYLDATVGQLLARLKNILGKPDLREWEPAHFVIGDEVFDFDDPFRRFMLTAPVRHALQSNPEGPLDCVITMRQRHEQQR